MTPAFRILPVLVLSLVVLFGMRSVELWTGVSAIGSARAGDVNAADAKSHDLTAPPSDTHASDAAPAAAPAGAPSASPTTPVAQGAPLPPSGSVTTLVAPSAEAKDTNIPALSQPEAAPPGAVAEINTPVASKPVVAARPKIPGEEDFMSASEIEVLSSLTKRREDLDKRAAVLDMREKLLIATEQRLDQKLAEIKVIEGQIQSTVHTLDENQKKQIASLVKVYENMKPKDAANIMQDLDKNILLEVAARMKEAKMAPILAAMDPAKAREVTVMLAKRNEVPGRNG